MEGVNQKRFEWEKNRKKGIARLKEIAETMEDWYLGGRIANIASSSVGIIGGGFILGGLLFPPLLIPGIVTSLIGVGGNIGSSVARFAAVKILANEVNRLLEEDAKLLSSFIEEAQICLKLSAGAGSATTAAAGALNAFIAVLRKTFITVPLGAAGKTSLKAIIPAAAMGPARAIAGATAGVGMAIDVVFIVLAAKSLARNQSDEIATKLREAAENMHKELNEATAALEWTHEEDDLLLVFRGYFEEDDEKKKKKKKIFIVYSDDFPKKKKEKLKMMMNFFLYSENILKKRKKKMRR